MALTKLVLLVLLLAEATQAGATVPRALYDPYYGALAAYNFHTHLPSSHDPKYPTSSAHSPKPAQYEQENVYEEPVQPTAFQYSVKDHYHGTEFSRHESSDASGTKGQYQVQLPDGRLQTVIYHADEDGFHAEVLYDGESHHPPPRDPSSHATPESIYPPTSQPTYHSTPEPIYHSTPEPVYHSTPEITYHSTPEAPIYHSTPKPVYQSTSELVFQSTPEPIYESTPEPVHRTEPKPVFSSPDPLYHSTPKPNHHSTSGLIFHSTPSPVYQTTPEPLYHSTSNSIISSSSEPPIYSPPPNTAYHTASSLRELAHQHSEVIPGLHKGVGPEYRTSIVFEPPGNGRGFKLPHEVTHSTGQTIQHTSKDGQSFQPSLEVVHSSQPAFGVTHSSQPAYNYEIAPFSTQHGSPVLFVLADGVSSESHPTGIHTPPSPFHRSSTSEHIVRTQDPSPKPIITSHAHGKPTEAPLSLNVNVDEPLFRSDPPHLISKV